MTRIEELQERVSKLEAELDLARRDRRLGDEQLSAFFEHSLLAMAITSPEKGWVRVNAYLCELLGRSEAELRELTWVELTHPDDLAADVEQFDRLLAGEIEGYRLEKRFTHADGSSIPTILSVACMRKEDGTVDYVLAQLQDIRERKARELELRRREADLEIVNESLRRSNEDLQQFAYVASHDLQEPLRMVGSYLQLLQRRYGGQLDADADEFIGYAVDGAKRMKQMINDLLVFSRIGTRGKKLETCDAHRVFRKARAQLAALVEETHAMLRVSDLPMVRADEGQLLQLFRQLLDNALKFRGDRAPKIEVEARREGEFWAFSVKDNGIGIDPQYRERIFVIFQRLHGVGKYGGSGIGLAICRRIVHRHGGSLSFESTPGEGTTFHFTLKAVDSP